MVSRTKKFRGSRTHGKGKKHGRGHGDRGGTGNAGLHKHKFKWMVKYDPDHFGRHGFVRQPYPRKLKLTINLGEIEERFDEFAARGAVKQEERVCIVDLTKLGYDKLLGGGRIGRPLRVLVGEASREAVTKVTKAGGEVAKGPEIVE